MASDHANAAAFIDYARKYHNAFGDISGDSDRLPARVHVIGHCTELALKGYLAATVGKWPKHHDLKKLARKAALEAELDSHLAEDLAENRKNGKSKKTVKSSSGKFELETPRDRAGTFEPKLVKKHQRTISDEIESKILSMYGLGMSYADIAGHVEEMYGIGVSAATISTITDKLIDEVKAWQARPP